MTYSLLAALLLNSLTVISYADAVNTLPDSGHTKSLTFDSTRIYIPKKESVISTFSTPVLLNQKGFIVSGGCPDTLMHFWDLENPDRSFDINMKQITNWCNNSAEHIIRPDSFYVMSSSGEFLLYDKGVVSKLCQTNDLLKKDGLWIPQQIMPYELFVQDDSILFCAVTLSPVSEGTFSGKAFGYPMTARINFRKNTVKYVGMRFPEKLAVGNYPSMRYVYQRYYGNSIYYFYNIGEEIVHYDLASDLLTSYILRSRFQTKEFKPLMNKIPNRVEARAWRERSGSYFDNFFYDPFRDVYYRFFVLPLEEQNNTGQYNSVEDTRISLMVIDRHFNIIAEELLPKGCFFIFYTAITRECLMINYGPVINPSRDGVKLLKIKVSER